MEKRKMRRKRERKKQRKMVWTKSAKFWKLTKKEVNSRSAADKMIFCAVSMATAMAEEMGPRRALYSPRKEQRKFSGQQSA